MMVSTLFFASIFSISKGNSVADLCEGPRSDPCDLWNMSRQVDGKEVLLGPAYIMQKSYEIEESGISMDAARLYEKCGHCTMVFRATDSGNAVDVLYGNATEDMGNNAKFTPIDKWGLSGVHAGVVAELEGLLALMDFQEIRDLCPGKFSVAGHSLGGAQAQLFAVLLTKTDDPLDAKLDFHELNTWGTYPAMQNGLNNQSDDGCFAGLQSWYAEKTEGGGYVVDSNYAEYLGALIHEPVRGSKVFLVPAADGAMTRVEYACGTALPDASDLLLKNPMLWGDLHEGYEKWSGCDSVQQRQKQQLSRSECCTQTSGASVDAVFASFPSLVVSMFMLLVGAH